MTKVRIGGLILVSIGASIVLLIQAFVLAVKAPDAVHDLIGSYYSAQCLVHHYDPYNPNAVLHIFRAEGGEHSLSNPATRDIITRYVYPPSAFAVMVPLSLMPWGVAHVLWAILSSGGLIIAAYLSWELSAKEAPVLGGAFIGYLLANSYVIVEISNPSELVIALCVIAVWCFIRERFVAIGILCMALSLAIKPQVPSLVWLYFLLAGGVFRKRALQTLLVTAVASAPFILWVWVVAPHWSDELRANLRYFSVHGGITDPGPSSATANEMVDLQVIISRVYDLPTVYNLVSYLAFAPLLLAWLVVSIGKRVSKIKALYALAAIAPLSMLPLYHHFYDTKLLLLTVPAVSLLWSRRDRIAWIALLLTGGTFLITGDISHRFIENLVLNLHPMHRELADRCVRALAVFPAPIILLLTGTFYLWIYWRTSQPLPEPALEQ
jgi:hypothetical protein